VDIDGDILIEPQLKAEKGIDLNWHHLRNMARLIVDEQLGTGLP
jgi:hypothetical protein